MSDFKYASQKLAMTENNMTLSNFKRMRWIGTSAEGTLKEKDPEAEIWELYKVARVYEQRGPVVGTCFCPAAPQNLLIAASLRVTLRHTVSLETEKNFCTIDGGVSCVCYRPDGRLAAIGSIAGKILILDASSRSILREFPSAHSGAVRAVTFLPDKVHLVSVGDDFTTCLWDITAGSLIWRAKENSDFVRAVAVSRHTESESDIFVTGSYDHSVLVWSVKEAKPLMKWDQKCPISAVTFLPGMKIAIGGDRSIKIWDMASESLEKEILIHHKTITTLSVSQDGKYLFSGSLDRSLKILRLSDFRLLHTFKLPSAILSFGIDQDYNRIAAGTSRALFTY